MSEAELTYKDFQSCFTKPDVFEALYLLFVELYPYAHTTTDPDKRKIKVDFGHLCRFKLTYYGPEILLFDMKLDFVKIKRVFTSEEAWTLLKALSEDTEFYSVIKTLWSIIHGPEEKRKQEEIGIYRELAKRWKEKNAS